MSQSRRIALLLIVVVGGIILGAVLLAPPRPNTSPLTPLGVVTVVTSTPPPTSVPAQISPTLAEPLASQPAAAAYPAPTEPETLAPIATAAPVSATAGAGEGRLAPEFDLVRENGARVRLSDYRGKETVVVVFFRGQT